MKLKTQTNPNIDINQPVELELPLSFQSTPMLVTGMYEEVLPVQVAYERTVKPYKATRAHVAAKIGNVASKGLEAVKQDVGVLAFDLVYNTNFRKELKERRLLNKKIAYAKRLGLI